MNVKVSVQSLPPCTIAYIRSIGPYGAANTGAIDKIKEWAANNNLLNDEAVILGIAQDNPQTTSPENCRYDACIVISGKDTVDAQKICRARISGGKHAVFRIEHTAAAVQKAWTEIFSEMTIRGWQPDGSRPIIERYPQKLVLNHECEICVPMCE